MDLDPIHKLSKRVNAIKKQRDELDKNLKTDKDGLENVATKLDELRAELAHRKEVTIEREKKLTRIDKLVSESEKTIRKIVETSITLEKALDQEPAIDDIEADEL